MPTHWNAVGKVKDINVIPALLDFIISTHTLNGSFSASDMSCVTTPYNFQTDMDITQMKTGVEQTATSL